MEYQELRHLFNIKFGMNERWPEKWEVDASTYGNICQAIFFHLKTTDNNEIVRIALGPNSGIMYKNVELILKSE